jgi:glutamyl-tRNA synthetase
MDVTALRQEGERVRFAPSPTGSLHVGNARTALINWLVARRSRGTLVLRIEDTDAERSTAESEESILRDLRWMGLSWDEGPGKPGTIGPYRQSERSDLYGQAEVALLAAGAIYPCFCSPEVLEDQRQAARSAGETFRYPGTCRDLSQKEVEIRSKEASPAYRFRVPDHPVGFVDGLRGETGVAAGEIGDFILIRSDGSPTYNLVCVVDDYAMRIDHVIRGEDHLTNTPRQLLIYEALGFEPPAFTHLPLVLGSDRGRLSKRHGATTVAEVRQMGILPAAFCNYLALLGWDPPGGREVWMLDDLREVYDLAAISPSNVVFDLTKLEWLNGQHLAEIPVGELLERAAPFMERAGYTFPESSAGLGWWGRLLDLVRKGCRRLDELAAAVAPIVEPDLGAVLKDPELRSAVSGELAVAVLAAFTSASNAGELRSDDGYRAAAKRVSAATGAKGRELFHPLRVAISAQDSGPELARMIPVIEEGAGLGGPVTVDSVAARIQSVLRGQEAARG